MIRILFILLIAAHVQAADRFEFNPVKGAEGYRLYFGTNVADLVQSVDLGKVIKYDLAELDLRCGATYYFSVIAYNEQGESAPSNIVKYVTGECPIPPAIPEGWKINGLILIKEAS
jgi:hypothetical protein